MEKKYKISQRGRVFRRGVHLNDQEIATIQYQTLKGKSPVEISKLLNMDARTVKKYTHNSIVSTGGKQKKENPYNDEVTRYLEETLKEDPTLYLNELKKKLEEDLGLNQSISTIQRNLTKMGMSRKKCDKIAFYRTTERVQNLRRQFRAAMENFNRFQFIYIDESSFDFSMQSVSFQILM
jgi:transposase